MTARRACSRMARSWPLRRRSASPARRATPSFPAQAADYCLRARRDHGRDLEYVGFYDKPLLKFERHPRHVSRGRSAGLPVIFHGSAHVAQGQAVSWTGSCGKLWLTVAEVLYAEHHESHAASAFFPSPFEEAAILTHGRRRRMGDGVLRVGARKRHRDPGRAALPALAGAAVFGVHLLHAGSRSTRGEYKVMGLAPYGEPEICRPDPRRTWSTCGTDGSFTLDHEYFNYCQGLTMTNGAFDSCSAAPPRARRRS